MKDETKQIFVGRSKRYNALLMLETLEKKWVETSQVTQKKRNLRILHVQFTSLGFE